MAKMNPNNNTDYMAAYSFRGNNAASPGLGIDLTVSQSLTLLGLPVTGGTIGYVMTWNGSVWVSSPAGGGYAPMPTTVVAGTSQAMAVNNSYVSNNAGLVTLTLPSTAAVGSVMQVSGLGAGGWKIAQNAGQLIRFNSAVSTTGVGGSLASTAQSNSVTIQCVVADTTFVVTAVSGNLDIV